MDNSMEGAATSASSSSDARPYAFGEPKMASEPDLQSLETASTLSMRQIPDGSSESTISDACTFYDHFVQFQAILACMPQHALSSESGSFLMGCSCSSRGSSDRNFSVGPVDRALMEAAKEYPRFADDLGKLRIVHVSADLVCFADHYRRRLFTAIRGTDVLTPRDIGNDTLIFLGFSTLRTDYVKDEYQAVRSKYPFYESYGCGHSLGGVVMHELAYALGDSQEYAFTRVDVFNAGGSPAAALWRAQTPPTYTEFLSHRCEGDLVSYFYEPLGRTVLYKPDPDHPVHLMGHFLPQKDMPPVERLLRQLSESGGGEHRELATLGQWRTNPSSPDYSGWPILNLAFGLPLPF